MDSPGNSILWVRGILIAACISSNLALSTLMTAGIWSTSISLPTWSKFSLDNNMHIVIIHVTMSLYPYCMYPGHITNVPIPILHVPRSHHKCPYTHTACTQVTSQMSLYPYCMYPGHMSLYPYCMYPGHMSLYPYCMYPGLNGGSWTGWWWGLVSRPASRSTQSVKGV